MKHTKRTIGPVTKTTASAALIAFIAWVVFASTGIEVPLEVQGSLTVLMVFIAGWLVPHDATQDGKHEV